MLTMCLVLIMGHGRTKTRILSSSPIFKTTEMRIIRSSLLQTNKQTHKNSILRKWENFQKSWSACGNSSLGFIEAVY